MSITSPIKPFGFGVVVELPSRPVTLVTGDIW